MKTASKKQIMIIRAAIAKQGKEEYKDDIIYSFSNGRTTSTRELTPQEASALIMQLNDTNSSERMRKKIFAMGYKAGIIYGETPEDKKMNAAKLDMFLKERGAVKKSLNSLNNLELVKVVNQFEQLSKHVAQSQFNKGLKTMLSDLRISSGKEASHV